MLSTISPPFAEISWFLMIILTFFPAVGGEYLIILLLSSLLTPDLRIHREDGDNHKQFIAQ